MLLFRTANRECDVDSSCTFVLDGLAPFELATAFRFGKVSVNLHSTAVWFAEAFLTYEI